MVEVPGSTAGEQAQTRRLLNSYMAAVIERQSDSNAENTDGATHYSKWSSGRILLAIHQRIKETKAIIEQLWMVSQKIQVRLILSSGTGPLWAVAP